MKHINRKYTYRNCLIKHHQISLKIILSYGHRKKKKNMENLAVILNLNYIMVNITHKFSDIN